jgi:surfeit locus 1 family protein
MKQSSKKIIFICFSVTMILIFILLGFWQLNRKIYKENLIKKIEIQTRLTETKYNPEEKDVLYRNFKFSGRFEDRLLFVYGTNKSNEVNGYFLLMPFILESGQKILVMRGWSRDIDSVRFFDRKEFSGLVVGTDKAGFFTPAPDLNKNIFYSFDISKINQLLKTDFQDFFIIEKNTNHSFAEVNQNKFINIYNRHFEYIITWFTLAFFTTILLLVNRKKL